MMVDQTPQQLLKLHAEYQGRIEKALRNLVAYAGSHRLKRLKDDLPTLFDDEKLSWMAEEYGHFITPPSKTPAKGEMLKRLKECRKQTAELRHTFGYLHGGGWKELQLAFAAQSDGSSVRNLVDVENAIARLHLAAIEAEKAISALPSRKGAEPDPRPLEVAKKAAYDFRRLTWDDPFRVVQKDMDTTKTYGAFLDFLSEVFAAVGIAASVDNWAKQAIDWWNNERNPMDFMQRERPRND